MSSNQIFISYVQDGNHDHGLAKSVHTQLAATGYKVFRDESGITPGLNWALEIERQLKSSSLLILIVSEKIKDSDWVMAEIDFAKELEIPIIPVASEVTLYPLWLRHLQVLDFSQCCDWELLFEAVVHHIGRITDTISASELNPLSLMLMKDISVNNDTYGQYIDLNIVDHVQRFRLIPPGKFMMGSPLSEKERYDQEDQHPVTLTQAFWMADTACTQAVWQAVMKKNESRFREDINNPVENVSWYNVQIFIEKLIQLYEGLNITLPTEAQWEYACRAGTNTPFYFGKNITSSQVNYDGNHPYIQGEKGISRKKTVQVKSMDSPNPLGLHEMHGNVWEWCQDSWKENLGNESACDPINTRSFARYALRGGAWLSDGWDCRSAVRGGDYFDSKSDCIGFRLVINP